MSVLREVAPLAVQKGTNNTNNTTVKRLVPLLNLCSQLTAIFDCQMLELGHVDYKDYVFNVRLAKLLGLCQMLHPNNVKYYGYNIYQLPIIFGMLLMGITGCVCGLTGMYHWSNDLTQSFWMYTFLQNIIFVIYKLVVIFKNSDDIWECLHVVSFDFLSYKFYDKSILKVWQTRTIRFTYIISVALIMTTVVWFVSPLIISDNYIKIRNHDGSYDSYRLSLFNLYFMVSTDVYNEYFSIFYIVETLIVFLYASLLVLSNIVIISLCTAIVGQLETINKGLENFEQNHINIQEQGMSNDYNLIGGRPEGKRAIKIQKYLKIILSDHQKVIKKLETFYKIIGKLILMEFFVFWANAVFTLFVVALNYYRNEIVDTVQTFKMIIGFAVFVFNLFMTCSLCTAINDEKEAIIFALYSTGWTEMDMESKRTVLLAMNMNNANNLCLRFTKDKLVDLNLFLKSIKLCYSIVSFLKNYA
ncbi:uncharacterized protein LOC126843211 [Adelges cooleyi]|uniref:uncharacterized protein LOC126843211 n=1 Tax=Adelges cooleyi TaxID=133065 RepID=UPI00217FCD71|nr:uncharacterized protein LOC126843211 [Adelges cooleyi]